VSAEHAFVVLAYGHSPYLAQCLESLSLQTHPARVVVATSTPSRSIRGAAEAFGAELIVNPRREGIAADWNFGLRVSGARFVTLAHQDDTYHPDFAGCSLGALEQHDAALCFTSYEEIDAYRRPVRGSKISRAKHFLEAVTLGRSSAPSAWRMWAFLALGNPLPCPSVTYDLDKLGDFTFSSDFASNLDWDAWLRLLDIGHRFARIVFPLVGRRHDEHTATSRLIADGTRATEDLLMFRRMWPAPVASAIALAYRAGY
jgi:hypothetical protein